MSCHVAIIVSKFLKKSFSKTFLFHKIIYKCFASLLVLINSLSHYEVFQKTEVISLIVDCFTFLRKFAMTKVNYTVITRKKSATKSGSRQVISLIDCFAFAKGGQSSKMLAMTRLYTVITRLFIAEVIHKKGILLFWIATPTSRLAMTEFVAMTRWFTFNLISFRDLSLLFIKKFITKGDLNYVKSQNNF